MKITGRDIVITGLQAWDNDIGSNCINIAKEFAKDNRVLYVNFPLDQRTILNGKNDEKIQKRLSIINDNKEDLEQVDRNIWTLYPKTIIQSINWIPVEPVFNFFNKRNNTKLAFQISKALKRLNFRNFFIFNDSDMFRSFYLKDLLKPELYIYYSRDNLIAVDYWKKHGIRIEAELIRKSDLCTANSTYLADYCRKFNPNSFYVGQGCDLSLFNPELVKNIPDDLKKINNPIIGYVGALVGLRLDIKLLEFIAENRPVWSIVLVGPEDDNFKNSRLHSLPNVYFLGAKKMDELPEYVKGFDVCINPQLVNEVTIGNYPRKIDEYLAMGKPTVATATTAMEVFKDYCYLAKTKEDYITEIENALNNNSEAEAARRRDFAMTHTWENNVKEIYKAINITLEERGKD
ncbi:MAG: glycosyltransferase [Ignavibacteria bacterium]|nr:glycosyltransferase [Ignavibacteria bacterium]